MEEQTIALGSKGRDKLTGLTGIVTGRTDWQYGCTRYCIEPRELKDGQPIEGSWFDVQRVEVLAPPESALATDAEQAGERSGPGGPQDDPSRSASRA